MPVTRRSFFESISIVEVVSEREAGRESSVACRTRHQARLLVASLMFSIGQRLFFRAAPPGPLTFGGPDGRDSAFASTRADVRARKWTRWDGERSIVGFFIPLSPPENSVARVGVV